MVVGLLGPYCEFPELALWVGFSVVIGVDCFRVSDGLGLPSGFALLVGYCASWGLPLCVAGVIHFECGFGF